MKITPSNIKVGIEDVNKQILRYLRAYESNPTRRDYFESRYDSKMDEYVKQIENILFPDRPSIVGDMKKIYKLFLDAQVDIKEKYFSLYNAGCKSAKMPSEFGNYGCIRQNIQLNLENGTLGISEMESIKEDIGDKRYQEILEDYIDGIPCAVSFEDFLKEERNKMVSGDSEFCDEEIQEIIDINSRVRYDHNGTVVLDDVRYDHNGTMVLD